jgi:hypothetical protein
MSTKIDLATELAAVKAQLKEQTQQMAEMASMMKSMMSLAMPLLEEQMCKLYMEKVVEYAMWKSTHLRSWQPCMWELEDEYHRFQHRFAKQKRSAEREAAPHKYEAIMHKYEADKQNRIARMAEREADFQKYKAEKQERDAATQKRLAELWALKIDE